MKKTVIAMLAAICCLFCSCGKSDEWTALNEAAAAEYLEPLRPGGVDGSPFWNVYSHKFTYAPAFDFAEVPGAAGYRFTVSSEEGAVIASFNASSPKAALSPVWNDIKPGQVRLVVEAVGADGKVIGEAGSRGFFRDFPFCGPYPGPARDYREAALKGLIYVHNLPCIRAWATGNGPDMSYPMNGYVCKIIGATVRIECMLAREVEYLREDALAAATAAAQYLVDNCTSEALKGWPPTYGQRPLQTGCYCDEIITASGGKTMTEEASAVGEAFLDMFDATSDSIWFERSLRVARTYAEIQNPDGSWPVKMFYESGKPACNMRLFPTHLLQYLLRLNKSYGVTEFEPVREKSDRYMAECVLPSFDMTGQFEDNQCDWTDPYSNLTNVTASGYASYLLRNGRGNVTPQSEKNAVDMIRFCEDQFLHWDNLPDWNGYKRTIAPCVHEQRAYEEAIDDSGASVADSYMALYEYNGDRLALEKAKALINSITRAQFAVNGRIPTVMAYNGGYDESSADIWVNCSWWSAQALMRLDSLMK